MRLLFLFLLIQNISIAQDTWEFKEDKKKHFGVGFCVGFSMPLVSKKHGFKIAISCGVLLGGGKEVVDLVSKKGDPSFKDFSYTVFGTVSGLLLTPRWFMKLEEFKFIGRRQTASYNTSGLQPNGLERFRTPFVYRPYAPFQQ